MSKSKSAAGIPPLAWLGIGLCLFLVFGDQQGCTLIGKPAPYPVTPDIPVAVAVAAKFSDPTSASQMTKDYPGVMGRVQDWVKGKKGQFREIDITGFPLTEPNLTYEADWVKAAYKAIDKTAPPRIIGATPNSGLPDQPLPKTVEDVDKALSGLLK